MKLTSYSTWLSPVAVALAMFAGTGVFGQDKKQMVNAIVQEANTNSKLEDYAFELIDMIGPRLVGSPQMQKAHDWVVRKYTEMGALARNEPYGEWRSWERGLSSITMTYPRIKALEGTQLSFSPSTKGKGIEAEVIVLPVFKSRTEFTNWLPSVKGKIVMIAMNQPTGRSDANWKESATAAAYDKMQALKKEQSNQWAASLEATGSTRRTLAIALEEAGALAVVDSYWTELPGVTRIFDAKTKKIPVVDIAQEDYGLLYRMVTRGVKPRILIQAEAKELGVAKTYNSIAEIKGKEKPEEYVVLSAHLDSWDGASGATDNGTGIITMMEAVRILKKVYPDNKRTILVGNWGSEEQGLNGSSAFVEDHPELHDKIQVVWNQDNGTGRIARISGNGFAQSYAYIGRWLQYLPEAFRNEIQTTFPGLPGSGGSDHASFVKKGIPAFMLGSTSWDYGKLTWHTNRDTYDKIVFDEVRQNAVIVAILTYLACEEPELVSREKMIMPTDTDGKQMQWPTLLNPKRTSGN
ncbi:M20/M25/M40 family metallo-hydrolase [Sphingobacterium spiritivorum]|uniref:M20/M25/M40 family metallo-hydrolase n=1 Tax=Sphingobacterium spiritivorum TaxID=258 RepID=UPI001919FCC0|nr:M20/M25/M40 family metallo-hydrolase [Sphingobacterium spiritivorum]QQT26470.1 M20/M25/M40 family metallo-hydrolase [Sphingobacterium spiritivorum]